MGGRVITIGKYSFKCLAESLSWRKSKTYDCSFGILVDTNILVEFFPIGTKYPLSKMIKQLRLGSPGGSYEMSEARFVASFKHILYLLFGGNSSSVLKN